MEFKYLVAQQTIEHLQKKLKEETEKVKQASSGGFSIRRIRSPSRRSTFNSCLERIETLQTEHSDAGIQTDSILTVDQPCQTIGSIRTDFQSQATIELEKETIAIQTDSFGKRDVQAQAYLQSESQSIAIQTIKEETETTNIRMPNTPNSVGQSQSKKRKLSSKPSTTSITTAT